MELYGYHPPSITSPLRVKSKVQALEDRIQHQQGIIHLYLKENLAITENKMKQQEDQRRNERNFEVKDWVFLKLAPYKKMSLKKQNKDNKLAPNYNGPYKMLHRIGSIIYRMELSPLSCACMVFHVSFLKKEIDDNIHGSDYFWRA
jgi:hypothetical protein